MTLVALTGGDFAAALGGATAVVVLTLAGSVALGILWRVFPGMPRDFPAVRRLVAAVCVAYFVLAMNGPGPGEPRSVRVVGTVLGLAGVFVLGLIENTVKARRARDRDAPTVAPEASREVGSVTGSRADDPPNR